MWESGSPPTGWSLYTSAQDKFVLGAGGSGRGPGYADACALGHFHSGTTQTGYANPGNHGHPLRFSNDTGDFWADADGGFVLDTDPTYTDTTQHTGAVGTPRGQQVGGSKSGMKGHTHTINTWGVLYNNTSYPSGMAGWTAIGGDNVSLDSSVTNRNIPPYISLYFIKKN